MAERLKVPQILFRCLILRGLVENIGGHPWTLMQGYTAVGKFSWAFICLNNLILKDLFPHFKIDPDSSSDE